MTSGLNPKDPLDLLAATEHYHVDSGKCASGWDNGVCVGEATTIGHVRGHVRDAGYNSTRKAIEACHSYGRSRKQLRERWIAQNDAGDGYSFRLRAKIKARKAELYG